MAGISLESAWGGHFSSLSVDEASCSGGALLITEEEEYLQASASQRQATGSMLSGSLGLRSKVASALFAVAGLVGVSLLADGRQRQQSAPLLAAPGAKILMQEVYPPGTTPYAADAAIAAPAAQEASPPGTAPYAADAAIAAPTSPDGYYGHPPKAVAPSSEVFPPPGTTLYCFSLMLPFGPEQGILVQHHQRNTGVFGCDGYSIFSNKTIDIAPGLQTIALPGSLKVEYGGRWNLALNTDVFIRVWKAVEYYGVYKQNDWVIKADIDCVWFPDRFRQLVSRTTTDQIPGPLIPGGPIWLNNCLWGLHGPLEVVSRDGYARFMANMDVGCKDIYDASMDIWPTGMPEGLQSKDHAFGEDQYLSWCLRQLGIPKVDEFESLLSEKMACTERPQNCGGKQVAFHSFKTEQEWIECYDYSTGQYGEWPKDAAAQAMPAQPAAQPAAAPQAGSPQAGYMPQPQQSPLQAGYPQAGYMPQPQQSPLQAGYPQAGYMPQPQQSPLQVALGRLQGVFR